MIRRLWRIWWLRHIHVCTEWDMATHRCLECHEPTGPLRPTLVDEMACARLDEEEPDA